MVYRLYRANRLLMTRIFVVLLIYSIIIGIIGVVLLGIVINFDAQSFNPQLFDANTPNAGLNNNAGLVCENYKAENCQWYLFNDLQNNVNYYRYSNVLGDIYNRVQEGNLILLKQSYTNSSILTNAQVQFLSTPVFNSTDLSQTLASTYDLPVCTSLYYGMNCTANSNGFSFIPNLNLYSSNVTFSEFLGNDVLLANTQTGLNILCPNYSNECPYYRVANYTYNYIGQDTQNYKKGDNYRAYEAIIKPNTLASNVGSLLDADRNSQITINCIREQNATFNNCYKMGLFESDPSSFIFVDNQNNIRIGTLQLNVMTGQNNDNFNFKTSYSNLTCQKSNQLITLMINNSLSISCLPSNSLDNSLQATFGYSNIVSPLDEKPNSRNPTLVFDLDNQSLLMKLVFIITSSKGKSSPTILMNILSRPDIIFQSLVKFDFTQQILIVVGIFFIVNLILAFLMVFLRSWKRIGGKLSKSILILQGKLGRILEITQFFQFGGSWYLEAQSVNDYNFKTTMGVVHEMVRERWRDTIFFPTSLAASISILIFSINSSPNSILSLFVLGGLLPLLLAFWLPALWVIEDSGLKRAEWSDNGELITIQKISSVIRDGFNKLVGFGAVFGIGTAGASVARARFLGTSVSSTAAISGGLDNLLSLNFNFLVSAILWTAALLFIVTSVSLTGNVITSLSYLNSDHLTNVKRMRTTLQKREIFLGTTQQALDHTNLDTSVYFDSKAGIDTALAQPVSSRKSQVMPTNQVITELKVNSEDDLTKIIITNPKDSDVAVKPIAKEVKEEKKEENQNSSNQSESANNTEKNESTNETEKAADSETEATSKDEQSNQKTENNP